MLSRLKAFYQLTKPGIVRGNAIHVMAGALLASRFSIDVVTFLAVLVGTSLVIASACVVNNYLDRSIDRRMKRTMRRPSVTGSVSLSTAMIFAGILLVAGLSVLFIWTSVVVVILGIIAYVSYVFIYGFAKRTTVHSTLIGAIPGALPAMAGYVAVVGDVTIGAWVVFLLVFTWQMPHFYAISIFRKEEYRSAGLPVLGVVKSFNYVYHTMFAYVLSYVAAVAAMIYFGVVGPPAGLLLLAGAAYWLVVFVATSTKDQSKWARSVFGSSLVLTLVLLLASILNVYVPPAL